MSNLDLKILCDHAVQIAYEAGDIIMEFYKNGAREMIKSDGSDVTEADLAADKYITEKLKELTPDIPVATEEGTEAGERPDISKGTYWLVDPLDGTKEFINRTDNFAVLISLIQDNKSVLGVGIIPARDIMIYGSKGNGSYISYDGEVQKLEKTKSTTPNIQRRYNGLGEYEGYEEVKAKFPFAEENTTHAFYCLPVIEDKADVFIFSKNLAKEWDIAPWDAIMREVGGIVCNTDGTDCVYDNPSENTYAFTTMRNADFRRYLSPTPKAPSNKLNP